MLMEPGGSVDVSWMDRKVFYHRIWSAGRLRIGH